MAVIVLTSASGSPGVTSTALGLTLSWPRPAVLVEADPTGGSGTLAGFFHGNVAHTGGLMDLALAHREDALSESLPTAMMPIPESTALLLPGVRSHQQARSLAILWSPLAEALVALERNGQDVIVDAGRLGLEGAPGPLLNKADLVLLTSRSTLPALSGARSWAQTLREDFDRVGSLPRLGIVLVGAGQPYSARDVRNVLGLPVMATLPWDPDAAAVFSVGARRPRKFDRGALVRALRSAAAALQAVVDRNRADLATATSVGRPA
ncbi:hypothetical protein [Allobranchiibius sp. CTAmp26]|uniref:hypothetical protein n=1 Tax=Allobranchiibius sp. CTAmp26 TaxID=2815214 RepID=UPI001AA13F5F|nr:hypothetical protein [Allobranchiibius sp. CTAmp26]MBO1756461.1 hypothetical protein [Allobranchiibius sp. CTAmp26]